MLNKTTVLTKESLKILGKEQTSLEIPFCSTRGDGVQSVFACSNEEVEVIISQSVFYLYRVESTSPGKTFRTLLFSINSTAKVCFILLCAT